MRGRDKAAQGVRDYLHSGNLLGMLGVHSPDVSSEKGGVQMKPYTPAIPSTDRKEVALVYAAMIEQKKTPAVISTECGWKCMVCGAVDYYISGVHMAKHGFESKQDAIRQGKLVKHGIQHKRKKGA